MDDANLTAALAAMANFAKMHPTAMDNFRSRLDGYQKLAAADDDMFSVLHVIEVRSAVHHIIHAFEAKAIDFFSMPAYKEAPVVKTYHFTNGKETTGDSSFSQADGTQPSADHALPVKRLRRRNG